MWHDFCIILPESHFIELICIIPGLSVFAYTWRYVVKFSELTKLLEENGFRIVKEKGSIRYYGKPGWDRLVRVDYHGAKEVPTGTCHSILKAAGITRK